MDRETVRQAYTSIADLYIELFGTSEKVHADDLAFIERHLVGRPGPVLDLGCGPGHITGHLRSLGVAATGIDMVPEFIAHARAAHPDVAFQLGSADSIAVADEVAAFDHKVVTAYRWPPDEIAERLAHAGFEEVARLRRPQDGDLRPHAAMAAVATDG